MEGKSDAEWMHEALKEARTAFEAGEVPVGAVVVAGGRLVGRGGNRIEGLKDATAHAEIIAIGAASEAVGDWRLDGATLVVTVEPCMMCLGAIFFLGLSPSDFLIIFSCSRTFVAMTVSRAALFSRCILSMVTASCVTGLFVLRCISLAMVLSFTVMTSPLASDLLVSGLSRSVYAG